MTGMAAQQEPGAVGYDYHLDSRLEPIRTAIDKNRDRLSELSERFRLNGFFSTGMAAVDKDVELAIYDIDNEYSAHSVSRLGVQISFDIDKDMSLTGQFVSRGVSDYDVKAEWAYLTWQPNSAFTFHLGRQRTPYYFLSEYLEVGYAYPWVRPPIELYNIPLSNVDGIGLLHRAKVGEWRFKSQAYLGSSSGYADQLEGSFQQNKAWGGTLFAEWSSWTFRVGFSTSKLDVKGRDEGGVGDLLITGIEAVHLFLESQRLTPSQIESLQTFVGRPLPDFEPLPFEDIESRYVSAGIQFESSQWLMLAEIGRLKIEDFIQPAGDGGYITLGRWFGRWFPYATYGKFYTDRYSDRQINLYKDAALWMGSLASGSEETAAYAQQATALYNSLVTLVQQQTSYTLGISYDINNRAKAKLEIARYEQMGQVDLISGFDLVNAPSGQIVGVAQYDAVEANGRFSGMPGASGGHIYLVSFAVDATF